MFAKQITDFGKFYGIVSNAVAKLDNSNVTNAVRWVNAIARASREIEENGEFMSYDVENNFLVIWSQGSDKVYSANGVCQCTAYTKGMELTEKPFPCWHRAAARIFRIYFGLAESNQPLPTAEAVTANTPPPSLQTSRSQQTVGARI